MHWRIDVEKPRVLLLAPTSVAAANVAGTTIHSGMGICYNDQFIL